jgi:hypothetical protein
VGVGVLIEVMREQLRLRHSDGRNIIAQRLGNAAVQDLAPALEQILIAGVQNERVLEAIIGIRR